MLFSNVNFIAIFTQNVGSFFHQFRVCYKTTALFTAEMKASKIIPEKLVFIVAKISHDMTNTKKKKTEIHL
jgi:hypothetical protein